MLVLTRKPGQSIMIGDSVEIQVLSVAGEKVRLGVTAPREVGIFRNEVYERISDERAEEALDEEQEREDEEQEREDEEQEREDEGSHPAPVGGRFAPRQ
jgi:carbon storage regulator